MSHGTIEAIEAQARPLAVQDQAQPPAPSFFDAMRPAEKLAFATEVADSLKSVIDAKRLGHKLNRQRPDDEYVELEAWQTCAFMCGMSAKIEWCKPIERGFEARAIVIRMDSGLEVGSGESRCTRNEKRWNSADDYALSGMAQTRAQSRALRGVLAWILVLAGFKPTPAEEMPEYEPPKAAAKTTRTAQPTTTIDATPAAPRSDDAARAAGIKAVHALLTETRYPEDKYRALIEELFAYAGLDKETDKFSSKVLNTEQLRILYRELKARAA